MSTSSHLTLPHAQRLTLNKHQKRWLGLRFAAWQRQRAMRVESGYVLARRLSCEMARIWGLYPTVRELQYEGGRRAYLLAFERASQAIYTFMIRVSIGVHQLATSHGRGERRSLE